jgi:hypothetical protein
VKLNPNEHITGIIINIAVPNNAGKINIKPAELFELTNFS